MDMTPDSAGSVFHVPQDVDLFPPPDLVEREVSPASSLISSSGDGATQKRRTRLGVRERRVIPQRRDYQVALLLARCRYLTAPQVLRALWPREAMPPRQTVNVLLGRLQRLGWVEKCAPLDTRLPVYQLTRRGYDVAAGVDLDVMTAYLPVPAVATVEHTLAVNDLVIAWGNGRGWLPDGFVVGRVVTEREITAVDRQPPRLPEKYQRRQQPEVFVPPGGGGMQDPDEPTYGYLTVDRRRGFPDALLLPAGGQGVQGAIAVEYQRTPKEIGDFSRVLLGYRRTSERTGGRFAAVLYISPDQSILNRVTAAAAEVAAEHLLITRLAPRPLYKEWPERTTPLQPKRPRGESEWERWLRLIPKEHRHLVPGYMRAGWSPEAAAEHLASPAT
jgi:hypothetical protein